MRLSGQLLQVGPEQLQAALLAGIAHVRSQREQLNAINVFPVPDGDTGTNLSFTLEQVSERLERTEARAVASLLDAVADAALDGARGNSGAIIAQFFHGLSEACDECEMLDAEKLAEAVGAGATSAWTAMSRPVPGTMPTVLQDFADALARGVSMGTRDLHVLLGRARRTAHRSLARTTEQLPVLRESGVVDAGAKGFVDLLDGIWQFMRTGRQPRQKSTVSRMRDGLRLGGLGRWKRRREAREQVTEGHRYCTECLLELTDTEQGFIELREALQALDASSLVVAGGGRRARVHIHTNRPGEVFRVASRFGTIRQQKADDMHRQHGLLNQRGGVAVVTDSAADLPAEEVDRLGIHVVPVRLSFDHEEFLDKLTITPGAFYQRLASFDGFPQTSQPPPADFRRQFELLASHGHHVLVLPISGQLSGTCQAAEQSAARITDATIEVHDTCNAACGQALLVLYAAEAAAAGWPLERIIAELQQLGPKTRTFALVRDLSWGVRGGRVKPWMHWMADRLALNPVLANTADGRLSARGVIPGRRRLVRRFAHWLARRMVRGQVYRIVISHTNARSDAERLRDLLLARHPEVDACWIVEASPAVGVHAGPGALIVGLQPWRAPVSMNDSEQDS